jgi:hypothetical protein
MSKNSALIVCFFFLSLRIEVKGWKNLFQNLAKYRSLKFRLHLMLLIGKRKRQSQPQEKKKKKKLWEGSVGKGKREDKRNIYIKLVVIFF